MARLRRSSVDSEDGSDYARSRSQGVHQATDFEPARSRRSPRKIAIKPHCDPKRSLGEEESRPSRLVAKALPDSTRPSKHVRLPPLRSPNPKLNSERWATNLHRPISPLGCRTPAKVTSTKEPATTIKAASSLWPDLSNGNDEVSVEESIWCGSSDVSDSSEDELPSPRKLIKPSLRPLRTTSLANPALEPCQSLGEPSISDSVDPPYPPLPAVRSQIATSQPPRPHSSSDRENNDLATLRFSPPRLHSPRKERSPGRTITPPPALPNEGRLLSPSKRTARIPTPPLRPSLDAFWNVETINGWNDHYSPKKEWKSPTKLRKFQERPSKSPTASPRKAQSPSKRTKAELEAKKEWATRKHSLAEDFLAQLDRTIAGGKIEELTASTGGVHLVWSKTLNSTAGRANWKRETTKSRQLDGTTVVAYKHNASIELAEKVIDDETRLLNVIAHEFCHLCNFMISEIKDQPHGRQFKEWGRKTTSAFRDRGVVVTTKHNYEIEYKYVWQCSNPLCEAEFKRHSKSIDPARHTCGSCRSRLVQVRPVPRKAAEGGGVNGYAAYVKLHFAEIRKAMHGASPKQVMEAIAQQYRTDKAAEGKNAVSKAIFEGKDPDLPIPDQAEVDEVALAMAVATISDDER